MRFISFLCLVVAFPIMAQDLPVKSKDLEPINVKGKRKVFKQVGLYDEEVIGLPNIRGFNQLTVFNKVLTDEFWCSKNEKCIKPTMRFSEKDTCLLLQWNKDQDGCDWVGMGFGWDMWSSKDMQYVLDTVALELEVRSTDKPFSNLPWAFGIEDYSGRQAWLGYKRTFLQTGEIGVNWTKVIIPFVYFPFEENDLDLTNVKQLIVQVFAEGSIEINHIKIIPTSQQMRKQISATKVVKPLRLDGNLEDWHTSFSSFGKEHKFAVSYTKDSLFFAFQVMDETPFMNNSVAGDLWNGDAIEIAFSTNNNADAQRKFFLLSDQHFGLNCGPKPYLWNWRAEKMEPEIDFAIGKPIAGYFTAELAIPCKQMFQFELKENMELGLEIAIDRADGQERKEQQRWNSPLEDGFHLSPSKWGTVQFK